MVHKFIHGLKPHIRSAVLMSNPTDLSSAMQHAVALDDISYNSYRKV